MEQTVSDILDNILGLLLLEGSYDIEETPDGFKVEIETKDAGRLIGARGESLEGLQLLVNQIISRKNPTKEGEEFKRVIIDVMDWRKQKEEDLTIQAKNWADQVIESGREMELEPMAPWQRRIVHMVVSEINGVESESVGDGFERHLLIKPAPAK